MAKTSSPDSSDGKTFLSQAFQDIVDPKRKLSFKQKLKLLRIAAWDPVRSYFKNMTGIAGIKIRQAYYAKYFKKMGRNCFIDEYVYIDLPKKISLGSNVRIDAFTRLEGGKCIDIGNRSHIGSGCTLTGGGGLYIGENVSIGAGSKIYSATASRGIRPEYQRAVVRKPVYIENDVVLGIHTIILPGVTIGEGAVLGSYSFINKDLPPRKVAFGIPARVVEDNPPSKLE